LWIKTIAPTGEAFSAPPEFDHIVRVFFKKKLDDISITCEPSASDG
jgi:hypothetical protein